MIAAVDSVIIQTETTEETKNLIRHQVSSLLMTHKPRGILPKVERDALRELKTERNIVIVPADKGRSTVVLDRTDYLQKAKNLLENRQFYVPCEINPSTTALANFDSALSADLATHRQEHNVPKTTLLPKPEVVAQKSPQKSSPKTVKHLPTKRPSHSKASARSQVKKKSQSSLAFKPSVPAAPSEQAEQPDPFADSDEQSSDEDITLSTSSNPKKRQRLYFSSEDEDEKPEEVKADTKRSCTKDTEEASSNNLPVHSPKSPGTMTRRAPAKQPSPAVEKVLHSVLKKSPTRKHDNAPATHAVQRQRVLKTFKDDDGFLITEKVWEGCDVEEPPEPSASKPAESSATIEKIPAKPKASSTSAKTSAKGHSGMPKQATLMSFFNR
nr:unnamed protein product [Spirometra erinaceieuropaei]